MLSGKGKYQSTDNRNTGVQKGNLPKERRVPWTKGTKKLKEHTET